MNNFEEPFRLRKRFRHEEERDFSRSPVHWNKNILDLESGSYLGRTPKQWIYLLLFYIVFYVALAILSVICYSIFRLTLRVDVPKWTLEQPGFSYEPCLDSPDYRGKIQYHPKKEDEVDLHVDRLENSLKKYGAIPKDYFGKCSSENEFGYNTSSPCVFLKINRIVGFKTEAIEKSEDLPEESPEYLYAFVNQLPAAKRKGRIWVSCQSDPSSLVMVYFPQPCYNTSVVDISGAIKHNPNHEDIEHFGKENARFYNALDFQRIIAVQFSEVVTNVKYTILCSLWAKNIKREIHGKVGSGAVRFQLQVIEENKGNNLER